MSHTEIKQAYRSLVVAELFTQELRQNLKDAGIGGDLFCDMITDSLDMINAKVNDAYYASCGVV